MDRSPDRGSTPLSSINAKPVNIEFTGFCYIKKFIERRIFMADKEANGIAYQNKDIASKIFAEKLLLMKPQKE